MRIIKSLTQMSVWWCSVVFNQALSHSAIHFHHELVRFPCNRKATFSLNDLSLVSLIFFKLLFNLLLSLCMSAGRAGRVSEAGTHQDWQPGQERWEQRSSGQGQLCFSGTTAQKRAGIICQIIPLSYRCSDVFICGPEREILRPGLLGGSEADMEFVQCHIHAYILYSVLFAST